MVSEMGLICLPFLCTQLTVYHFSLSLCLSPTWLVSADPSTHRAQFWHQKEKSNGRWWQKAKLQVFGSRDGAPSLPGHGPPSAQCGYFQAELVGILLEQGQPPGTICVPTVSLWFLISSSPSLSLHFLSLLTDFLPLPVPDCVSVYQIESLSLIMPLIFTQPVSVKL